MESALVIAIGLKKKKKKNDKLHQVSRIGDVTVVPIHQSMGADKNDTLPQLLY